MVMMVTRNRLNLALDRCVKSLMSVPMRDWTADLDHEISRLIRLHHIMNASDYKTKYAKPIRRAIDVAYASHFRALTEFFHDGRPKKKPPPSDLTYTEAAGEPTPFTYDSYGEQRLADADKLVGHLSKQRRSHTSDWGCKRDWEFMWPKICRLIGRPCLSLPETSAAIAEAGLTT